jgi:hypothetical protein
MELQESLRANFFEVYELNVVNLYKLRLYGFPMDGLHKAGAGS